MWNMFGRYIHGPKQNTFHGSFSTGTTAQLSSTTQFVCTLLIFRKPGNGNLPIGILQTYEYISHKYPSSLE